MGPFRRRPRAHFTREETIADILTVLLLLWATALVLWILLDVNPFIAFTVGAAVLGLLTPMVRPRLHRRLARRAERPR